MDLINNVLLKKLENVSKKNSAEKTIGVLVATGFAFYFLKKTLNKKLDASKSNTHKEIPVPEGSVYYLGHLPSLGELPAKSITKWHKKYGPLLHVKMGVQNWVFIGDPIMAHDIFVSQGVNASGRPFFTFGSGVIGAGQRGIVFNDYGKNWKNARTAVLGVLAPNIINEFEDLLSKESERCVNQIINLTKTEGEVDPVKYIRLFSINVILSIAYGLDALKTLDDPLFVNILDVIDTGLRFTGPLADISAYLPVLSFLDVIFRKERTMKHFFDTISFPLFERLVRAARENSNENLVKKIDRVRDNLGIDDRNVKIILGEILVAGGDTVSVSAVWSYVLLCNYPEVQKKVIQELDEFIEKNSRLPSFNDRLELPYYIAFQKECLRFRPATFFGLPHKASKDIVYKDYIIPEGTVLISSVDTTHFDEKYFYEPEKFIPERFLENTKTMYASSNGNINNRDMYIFGWGRRMCPGIALAENELFYNITRLLSRCTIEPLITSTGEKIYPDMYTLVDNGATVYPTKAKMRFVPRENSLII